MTMVGADEATGKAVYRKMWCNTYGCSRCGPRRYRRARKAIIAAAEKYKLTKFWTLTLDPQRIPVGVDIRGQIAYLRLCWRKLRVYIKREFGESIAFIAVVELQRSGVPHLHVLIGEWIAHAWMKDAWSRLGGGEIVWVEPISIRRVAAYLSKYITKERLNTLPTSVRRFSASQGIVFFAKVDRTNGPSWSVVRLPIEVLRASAQAVEDERYWTDADGARTLAWFVAELVFLTTLFKLRFRSRRKQ